MVTEGPSVAPSLSAALLPAAIAELVEKHARGNVLVTQSGARRIVLFAGGRVRQVASALESERLGAWLVARGVVNRKAVEGASATRGEAERLGDALIRLHVLSPSELQGELRLLSLAIAARMLGDAGSVEYESDGQGSEGPEGIDSAPLDLFVAGARRGADAGRLEAMLGGELRWIAVPAPPRAAGIELGGLEKFVLTQLNAPKSLAELRQAVPDQRVELVRALAVLVIAGLAGPAAAAGSELPGAGAGAAAAHGRGTGQYLVLPSASPAVKERLAAVDPPPAVVPPPRPEAPTAKPVPTDEQLDAAAADRREAFELLHAGGDARGAYRLLTRVADVAPDAEVLLEMARIELANPLWRQRALDHLKSALGINPKLTAAWLELANYWSLRGEPDKQRRCLESVLKYDPGNAEVRGALDLVRGSRS
jgi:hypothetical protein